jgi:hypothetical protein
MCEFETDNETRNFTSPELVIVTSIGSINAMQILIFIPCETREPCSRPAASYIPSGLTSP